MRHTIVFEDGTVIHRTNTCGGCGHQVDTALMRVSLERFNKVLCWHCIEQTIKRLTGFDLQTHLERAKATMLTG